MSNEEIRELVKKVKAGLRITKVVCTRSVKGRAGDSFVGFSAAYNTVQEDGGQDLLNVSEDDDPTRSAGAMSLAEAIVATCLLAREADIAAHRNAMAGGNISVEYCNDAISAIKANYSKILMDELGSLSAEVKE